MRSGSDWRRYGAFYQVYPRSFADSDGDGVGDVRGIRNHLPYLAALSLDGVWVNPWYPSPGHDGGYDVSDHRGIAPELGTLDDAVGLIDDAARLGLRTIVDVVPNHVSSDHPWFREALAAGRGSPERLRFHFRDGAGDDGSAPPNDWRSHFGGPAWTRVDDGQWYLHLFDASQPDVNWSHPDVQADFDETLRFWRSLGVDGFRVDVAHAVAKDPALPPWPVPPVDPVIPVGVDHPYKDRDELHEHVRRWRQVADDAGPTPALLVAEAVVSPWERLQRFLRPGEYDQAFNFEFLDCPWDADEYRTVIDRSIAGAAAVGALPTWVLSNHDVVRVATRFGLPADVDAAGWLLAGDRELLDPELGLRRARAAALLMLALPGACYVYQGDELGLPEVIDLPLDRLTDPTFERSGRTLKGRDGCRVPMPWTTDAPGYGFTTGESWLPMPEGWGNHSVAAQSGRPGSTLELYRTGLAIRAERLRHDSFEWLDLGDDVVAFDRRGIRCVLNLGPVPVRLPDGQPLLTTEPLDGRLLPPETGVWLTA